MGPYKSYTSLINKINCPLSFPELIAFGRFTLQLSAVFVFKLFIHIANYHSLRSLSLPFSLSRSLNFPRSQIQRSKVSSGRNFLSWINHFMPSFNITIKQFTVWISTANMPRHTTEGNVLYYRGKCVLQSPDGQAETHMPSSGLGAASYVHSYVNISRTLKGINNGKNENVQQYWHLFYLGHRGAFYSFPALQPVGCRASTFYWGSLWRYCLSLSLKWMQRQAFYSWHASAIHTAVWIKWQHDRIYTVNWALFLL